MENVFGLDIEIIDKALRNGIKVEVNGQLIDPPGVTSLAYHPQLRRYILVTGSTAQNASFVLLEDYNKLWKLK